MPPSRFFIAFVVAVVLIAPWHEVGHVIFCGLQGIPAGMSWTREFPLRDHMVHQAAVGSWGGIVFSWIALGASFGFVWSRRGPHLSLPLALFLAQSVPLLMVDGRRHRLK